MTNFTVKLPDGQEINIFPVPLKDYSLAYQHYVLALAHSDSTVPNMGLPVVYTHIIQTLLWLGMPQDVIDIMRNEQITEWLVFTIGEEDGEKLPLSGALWMLNGCWEHRLQKKLDQGKAALKDGIKPEHKIVNKPKRVFIGSRIVLALIRKINERKQS